MQKAGVGEDKDVEMALTRSMEFLPRILLQDGLFVDEFVVFNFDSDSRFSFGPLQADDARAATDIHVVRKGYFGGHYQSHFDQRTLGQLEVSPKQCASTTQVLSETGPGSAFRRNSHQDR